MPPTRQPGNLNFHFVFFANISRRVRKLISRKFLSKISKIRDTKNNIHFMHFVFWPCIFGQDPNSGRNIYITCHTLRYLLGYIYILYFFAASAFSDLYFLLVVFVILVFHVKWMFLPPLSVKLPLTFFPFGAKYSLYVKREMTREREKHRDSQKKKTKRER